MRRAVRWLGWWPAALAICVWLVAVGWPMIALMPALLRSVTEPTATVSGFKSMGELLVTSIMWASMVALLSAMLGWLPGRLLGSLLTRRGFAPAASFILVPVCLPVYLVYYAWWQSWPAGTAFHKWVIEQHGMQLARDGTLLIGLVCWSWPLVALSMAGASARRPRVQDEMLIIDGAPGWRISIDRLRSDLPGLALGGLLVFLTTLNNTTCFDLAEVFTFANELRARAALGATPPQTLQAALPMIAIALAGALAVWWCIGRRGKSSEIPGHSSRSGTAAAITTSVVWLVTVLVPLALFWRGVSATGGTWPAVREFTQLYTTNTLASLWLAACSGVAAMLTALGLAMMWHSERSSWRAIAQVISITWLLWALLPGTILGLALQTAYNRGVFVEAIFLSPVILNLAHLAGAGFVAVLLSRWSVLSEPKSLRDLRRIDGAQGLSGLWRSARPTMLAASLASAAIVFVLAVGETAITAQIVPPLPVDQTPIAMTLLNDMHYQRPQTVLVASALLLALAIGAAIAVTLLWRATITFRRVSGHALSIVAISFTLATLSGCFGRSDRSPPLEADEIFGSPGSALGQFGYPRCIDVDRQRKCVYVIDKTARVQRFGFDGKAQIEWHMPEMAQGKPTGVTVGPDGNVWVADTHYFRVIEYDPDGHEIRRFGEYGEGPKQFIYVTDIAFAPNGNMYVSEYGGHDRVQVFSPTSDYLFEFGTYGLDQGQFRRPQSLAFSRDGRELYITDACNHRIVVTDLQGHWLRTFGTAGREPGQLTYPYGLVVLSDDSLLVAEFGNNRIQRFDRNGRSLGIYGRVGRRSGELQYPWGVAASDDRIFVLDSGNNRVQVVKMF